MFSRKDLNLTLLSFMAIGLSVLIVFSSSEGPTNVSDSLTSKKWSQPSIGFADLVNSGSISHDVVVENTDFSRKIVNFDPASSAAQREALLAEIEGEVVGEIDSDSVVVKVSDDKIAEAEKTLSEDDSVSNSETDYAVQVLANPDWGVQKIRAPEVWDETRASGVLVAVVDTGIDRGHSEFSGKYAGGYDFVNDDSDPQDDHGHGTAVAGIAAASQNGSGTIGVGPEITILAAKVLDSGGLGYISDVVSGIDWAVENGASVINLSLGTTYDSSNLKSAVDRASSSGALVVAAAGNTSGGSLTYPAAYDSVIAVGATDSQDRLASFSAVGSEIVAPGVSVTTSWLGGGYSQISGTSASSPHVAGVAAHLISQNISNLRQALRDGTVDLGDEGTDPYFGYGRTDTVLALGAEDEDEEAPVVRFITPTGNQNLSGRALVKIEAADNKEVLKVDLVVNGNFVYSSAKAPYQWIWDLSDTAAGEYQLTAKAYDEAGNIGQESIRVNVLAPGSTTMPTISPGTQSGDIDYDQIQESLPEPAIEKFNQRGLPEPSKAGERGRGRGRSRVRGIYTSNDPLWLKVVRIIFRI